MKHLHATNCLGIQNIQNWNHTAAVHQICLKILTAFISLILLTSKPPSIFGRQTASQKINLHLSIQAGTDHKKWGNNDSNFFITVPGMPNKPDQYVTVAAGSRPEFLVMTPINMETNRQ
ncbi:hypothetical protein NE237_025600 [Protea cynaroides]|uniref:Uncharacterized protein n=1 Tax=Protea cynaroides TaxID=273540 RepID=A0A9Q0JZN3_9MAGN|nr:hypothetical protein NE237_025600 [Protea cynaroides]